MGLALCSKGHSGRTTTFSQYRISQQWHVSDEEETDDEGTSDFVQSIRFKSVSIDSNSAPVKTTLNKREKSQRASGVRQIRSFSLEDRMKDWHQSSVVYRKAERAAKVYTEIVKDDTLRHLSNTIRLAGSIADKGGDINEELRRQEHVLRQADTDISFVEYQSDQATEILKGMRSLRGKVGSIRKKKPKLKVQVFNDCDLLNPEMGLCIMSARITPKPEPTNVGSPKDLKEQQIKAGMGELNMALDSIKMQQVDAALTLDRQERHLVVFGNKLDTTRTKINQQRHVISGIMGQS